MAGDWIKWTKGLAKRREVLGIASRLAIHPVHAAGLCMTFWEWLDDNVASSHIDGNGNACVTLGALQPDFIDSLVCASGFAAALTAEGWLCLRSGSLTVPNYCRHNGQTSKERALTAERVAKTRAKNRPKCNGASVTAVTVKSLPEKRREEKRREDEATHTGSPPKVALPPPFDNQTASQLFSEWFAYLSKRNKQPIDPALAACKACGFFGSLEELRQSINYAMSNGYVTLKNYAADLGPRRGAATPSDEDCKLTEEDLK
jgi:hypothetical protein